MLKIDYVNYLAGHWKLKQKLKRILISYAEKHFHSFKQVALTLHDL